jgi:8-oxo-dGTP diphosphatase
MKPINAYKYCPVCSLPFAKKAKGLLICKNNHKLYINPIPCNAAIIENDKAEILLVKRKVDPMKGYWDWPGGFIEPGESFEESVKREIMEELNVEIKIEKILGIYKDTYLYQNIENPTLCIVVVAKIIKGKLKASDDIDGFKFFSRKEVLNQKFAFDSVKKGIKDFLKQ